MRGRVGGARGTSVVITVRYPVPPLPGRPRWVSVTQEDRRDPGSVVGVEDTTGEVAECVAEADRASDPGGPVTTWPRTTLTEGRGDRDRRGRANRFVAGRPRPRRPSRVVFEDRHWVEGRATGVVGVQSRRDPCLTDDTRWEGVGRTGGIP